MTTPTTAAGKRLLAGSLWDEGVGAEQITEAILAIEREAAENEREYHRETRHLVVDGACREAVAAEAARWRRIPGTYRLDDQTTEVIVDVPEAASFLVDEFPDEVALIQREAVAAALARVRERVEKMYTRHLDAAAREAWEGNARLEAQASALTCAAVLAILDEEAAK